MHQVRFEHIDKRFDDGRFALKDFHLAVSGGELLVLVGPSGSGKSTALRLLAGLEEPTHGEIYIGERRIDGVPPQQRNLAMVFQNYALYPHMSVAANLEFPLKMQRLPRSERRRRVVEVAELLGMGDLLQRKPAQLSGGQRQRVAMGRALVRKPQVFLMDEPLSNLDAKLRVAIRTEIADLQRRLGVTTIYVTHDQIEAMTLGQRVAVLDQGCLQQVDAPINLYRNPANTFVARFIGTPGMNILPVQVEKSNGGYVAKVGKVSLELALAPRQAKAVGFRPEALKYANGVTATISVMPLALERLGHEQLVYFHWPGLESLTPVSVRLAASCDCRVGENIDLELEPDLTWFEDDGRSIQNETED
jgi:ABC-type sugar transport system ATPase subunit